MEKENKNEKSENRFINFIKNKWLIEITSTIILILIIIASFICINFFVHNLELAPIDLSQEKLFTLTDETKEKIKNIDKDVNIYFVGFNNENDSTYVEQNISIAKQYKNINNKIKVEVVSAESRPDLVQKYGIETGTQGIIIECGEKSKVLTLNDLYTTDITTYETINVAEERFTSSILSVVSDKVPNIYFLEGYSSTYSLSYNMYYLGMYLKNEVNEIKTLNVLITGKIPDDCDTLIICTPTKDFDDIATNAIIEYINSGRNILWLNSAVAKQQDFPNVNKILAIYGVKPFEVGSILETNSDKMVTQTPYMILPDINYSTVTKDLYNSEGVIFIDATKLNFLGEEELANLNVTKNDLLTTSSKAFFRKDFSIQTLEKTQSDEEGVFVVGAELEKTIKENDEENEEKSVKSKLIIFGDNNFISDYPISNNQTPIFVLGKNKDLILNSMAYLVDRQEDITARKDIGTVVYTATEQEDLIIKIIIFTVPSLIIFAGIVVWFVRKLKR